MRKYLNLGCGNRCHPDWVNVDFIATNAGVMAYDLRNGIPYEDESFDVIYHSHVLEHFSKQDAIRLTQECCRVLRPGGIIRIAVPDLQQLTKQYLQMLENVESVNNTINQANYEWAVIELIDQMVRRQSGGEMLAYWQQQPVPNEKLLLARMGSEYLQWKKNCTPTIPEILIKANTPSKVQRFFSRFKKSKAATIPFEDCGERHQWMYDQYSLKKLLRDGGFSDIKTTTAFQSSIPGWDIYQWLDVENGKMRKPDSLYMEAIKP